jgi:hypothetical protein
MRNYIDGVFIGKRNNGKILFLVLITQNSKTLFSLLLYFYEFCYVLNIGVLPK